MTPARVRELSGPVIEDWVNRHEQNLLAQLRQQPPDGHTVTGLNACLTAVGQHAVQQLVVPTGPGQVGPAARVVVALGRPVQGPGAPRVESPERLLRMWEMLSGVGDQLNLETMPPETLARIQRLLKTVTAELQRSVSPALAAELHHLIDDGGAGASASEVRIEYASLLGWLGGLVISMYAQLQDSKRELLLAGRRMREVPDEHT